MNNGIITRQTLHPMTPTVQQTGEKNLYVTNNEGGIVYINNNFTQNGTVNSAEKMMAVQAFNREYYQLIVTLDEDAFKDNVVSVATNRALTESRVPPEIFERCSKLSETGKEELKTFPALICMENTEMSGKTDPRQIGIYAYIKKIQKVGKNIKIVFEPLGTFFQFKLCEKKNAVYFDLNMDCAITDLNQCAWSVHKTDLFEAFDEAGIPNMPRPV